LLAPQLGEMTERQESLDNKTARQREETMARIHQPADETMVFERIDQTRGGLLSDDGMNHWMSETARRLRTDLNNS
jgi:hypothetical protein